MTRKLIQLKPGREKSVLLRHPWIFVSAIQDIQGSPDSGEPVIVVDSQGKFLAHAAYSQKSQIIGRIWNWIEEENIDAEFINKKIQNAFEFRKNLEISKTTTAIRQVFGESDQLPGLIVDQYNNGLVTQFLSAGTEYFREAIVDSLKKIAKPKFIYDRSDVDVRGLEGLSETTGLIEGNLNDGEIIIVENNVKFKVDPIGGQKTGFYIDQRVNREKVKQLSSGLDVLNCFCYTGGFTLNALAGGAKTVLSIDSSENALMRMDENISLNQLDSSRSTKICGDVFKLLRLFRDQARNFDLIILDPPKFAPTVSQAEKAARGYKDINLLAIKLLRPGGTLVTFSCSGGISRDLFQKIVTGAAQDAGENVRIVDYLSQAADHPVSLNFPESFYLKGLICKK